MELGHRPLLILEYNIDVSLESVVNVNRVCVVFIMFPDHDVCTGNGYYYCYIIGTVLL